MSIRKAGVPVPVQEGQSVSLEGQSLRQMRGNELVAEALRSQGVQHVFGVLGYPIIELGMALQAAGLKYYGCRNEQAASYAAGCVGYLTGRPGCMVTVPGPGAIHAVAGMANASVNCWPMICVAGATELSQEGMGAFQETWDPHGGFQTQSQYPEAACKYTAKVVDATRIPYFVEQAVRYAINGRPGAVYLEIGGDTLRGKVSPGVFFPPRCADPPLSPAPAAAIDAAISCLRAAKAPLIIIGKGAAYARASSEVRASDMYANISRAWFQMRWLLIAPGACGEHGLPVLADSDG